MSISEPSKFLTPWAESGLKNPIPSSSNPVTGRAGFDQGFSAINMTPKESGGIPPFGQDFNGIFFEITSVLRYMQAGGRHTFSTELAENIGGYPKGAVVMGDDGVSAFQNSIDSNISNPNLGGEGWERVDPYALTQQSGLLDPEANWMDIPSYSDPNFGDLLNAQAEALAARSELLLIDVREALRRGYGRAGMRLVAGSFEDGATLTKASDVVLYEANGKAYSFRGAYPVGGYIVPPDSSPSASFVDASPLLGSDLPTIDVAAYGFNPSASAYDNSIALQRAAAAANATGGCFIEFPEGVFDVGYQTFAGATGLGYSYQAGQYFRLKDLNKPVLLRFNNTKINFGEGQRVGAFDPVTGAPMPTIQTNFDYRANRGILFGSERCAYVGATGQLEIDFKGETVILGGEFGDDGYQCPEYGLWFIDHEKLISNVNYTGYNGAMDAIYLAGLIGDDCFSDVSGLNVERMGRSGVVIAGGSNVRINGRSDKCGLGSITSSPGHNFAIESEVRAVDNVEYNILSGDALSCSFSIYSTGPRMVRNVKVLGGVLENTVGYTCKSNTSELKYIGTTIRGVVAEHRDEFFDLDRDSRAAEMIDCNHYDYTISNIETPFKDGTHFDRSKIIRLKLSNHKLFSDGLTAARFTLGKLYEPELNGFVATFIGDITPVATTGQRVLALENPVSLMDVELINRTTGSGGADLRAYVEVLGIENAVIRNTRISGIGQPTSTILWLSAFISAGGRAGYLTEGSPLAKTSAVRFMPIAIDGHNTRAQALGGYTRVFVVSDVPTTGNWDWVVGDYLIRAAPQTGQIIGWRCTTAGKAGAGAVFKSVGTLL